MRQMGKESSNGSGSFNASSPIPPVIPSRPTEYTLTQAPSQEGQGKQAPPKQAEEFRSYNPKFDYMKGTRTKKRLKRMVEPDENCETRVEDVAWLCSLSESEIDMLIGLKLLIIQRAKMIGCKELVKKFTLKMIRAIALVLMEHLKEEIKDSSLIPNTVKSTALLDASNLLNCKNEFDADIYELSAILGADIEKLFRSPLTPKRKKQKLGSSSD